MAATDGPSAAWVLPAGPFAAGELRRDATRFAADAGAPDDVREAVALAVSETVTNVIVHAYGDGEGQVRLSCRVDGERLVVEVADDGLGIAPRHDSPGIGHGLAMVGAVVQTLEFGTGADGRGTTVRMTFGPGAAPDASAGWEVLCRLALDTVADVSCVDLVREGVLRRTAAAVAGEPALTSWLRGALPPAKPGTATWAALREGGARLVVHDRAVPRSPGGTGERLSLEWWVAIPVAGMGDGASAMWGLGGRAGGRPVPSDAVMRIVVAAAGRDLLHPAEHAVLRARLAVAPR